MEFYKWDLDILFNLGYVRVFIEEVGEIMESNTTKQKNEVAMIKECSRWPVRTSMCWASTFVLISCLFHTSYGPSILLHLVLPLNGIHYKAKPDTPSIHTTYMNTLYEVQCECDFSSTNLNLVLGALLAYTNILD